jgi:hypothetical protein
MGKSSTPSSLRASHAQYAGLKPLRAFLLSSVTVGTLCFGTGQADAACVAGPGLNEVTCTGGDLGGGVPSPAPGTEVLNVNTLTANIAPPAGVNGIDFTAGGVPLTLNSNLGASTITTTGAGIGINAVGGSTVTITHSGTVSSAAGDAINASAVGVLTLASTGALTSTGGFGIDADTSGVGATIAVTTGASSVIAGAQGGISATTVNANASVVTTTTNVSSSGGIGIEVSAGGAGSATVNSSGNVSGAGGAISASAANGGVSVTSNGTLTSSGGAGISAVTTGVLNGISITSTGNITSAAGASAIQAQGDGDIAVIINSGTVQGGTAAGTAAVEFIGGANNTLTNAGTLGVASSFAILGTSGNDVVTNQSGGVINGDVSLDGGANSFNNQAGAILNSGVALNVGAGNTVTNAGSLRPGANGTVGTTNVTGNLTQTAAGTLAVDINGESGANDRITVTQAANMDGALTVNRLGNSLDVKEFTIISAGVSLASTMTVSDTAAFNYTLSQAGNDLILSIQLLAISPLVTTPMNSNQAATVAYLDDILANAPSPAMVLFLDTIGGLATSQDIVAALDRLNPQSYASGVMTTVQGSQAFVNSLMSCPQANEEGLIHREGQCYYAQLRGRNTDWDRSSSNIGGSEDAGGVTAGMQSFYTHNWLLGGALSYEHSDIDTNNFASSDGDRFSGGLVAKGLYGDTTVAGAIFGGGGWFDTTRIVTPVVTATSDSDVGFGGAGVRVSHVFDQGGWYAKPIFDAGMTYVSYGDIRETGAGVANLIVDGESDWIFNVGAAVEFGGVIQIQNSLFMRPYIRAGVIALSETDYSFTSTFEGAPAGVGPFTVTTSYDDVMADIGLGVDVYATASGFSVNIGYDGKFGDISETHAGTAKLRMAF